MQQKKVRWLPLKEILFTYLAISKILYWIETISAMDQSDFGTVGEVVLMRLLQRDLLLITIVILFYLLDKLIEKKLRSGNVINGVILYAAGFVGMIGLFYAYAWILGWFFPVGVPPIRTFISQWILGYIAVIVALNVKYYFKAKEKETYDNT